MTRTILWLSLALVLGCAKPLGKLNVPTDRAQKGTFVVRIRERCELQAENARKIICPRFRRWMPMKVIKLIPEGTVVKKGELLLSLDKTELKRIERDQKADVRRAKAEVVRLTKGLAIERQRLGSELERREAELRIKELAVIYLESLPTAVAATDAQVALRKAELKAAFAQDEFEPVKVLAKLGYQSQARFRELELAASQAAIERSAKKLSCDRTMEGAKKLELQEGKLDLRLARLRYQRAKCELDYRVKEAQKSLAAADWDRKREELELERFQESIKLADFHAPKAGVVVFQKVFQGSALEKIKEGVSVRPRHHLMSIEDMSTMIAEAQIEEAQISLLKLDQHAEIRLDAVQDTRFTGKVIEIGAIAREKGEKRTGHWWRGQAGREDSGIRVFDIKIRLDGADPRLRSNMAGSAQIVIEQIPNAVSIPLTAVFKRSDGTSYAYVVEEGRAVRRTIRIGRSTEGRVVVAEGLAENEVVCLAEPEGQP